MLQSMVLQRLGHDLPTELTDSILYGPTCTSIHDLWKNHSFDYMDLGRQLHLSFVICCSGLS